MVNEPLQYLGVGPPPISDKQRFIGIHYKKCNNPRGHCYWEGATFKECHPKHTPPETNMETKFEGLEDDFPFQRGDF